MSTFCFKSAYWVTFAHILTAQALSVHQNAGKPCLNMRAVCNSYLATDQYFGTYTIEIDNDERGVICDFTTISDIRITKAKPE